MWLRSEAAYTRGLTPRAGFTLVELVSIILLLGILGAVAGPRFFTASSYAAKGYGDAAAGFLRYARKLAVARHASVVVQVAGDGLSLCSSSGNPCPDASPWPGPQGDTPYRIDTPEGVSFSGSAASVSFDAQGRPSSGLTLTIVGTASYTLTVEAETGYVY